MWTTYKFIANQNRTASTKTEPMPNPKTGVYLIKATCNVFIAEVEAAKLTHFSKYARHQIERGGVTYSGTLPHGSVTLPEGKFGGVEGNEKALKTVMTWINGNDIVNTQTMTRRVLGDDPDFLGAAYVHKALDDLFVPRNLHGNSIRDDMIWYMRASPLTRDEFAIVMEVCDSDSSLKFMAKSSTIEQKFKRGGVPEWERIKEFAKEMSIFEEMERMERGIVQRKEHERKRAERKKEEEWSTLK